jgi:hypothetical protein
MTTKTTTKISNDTIWSKYPLGVKDFIFYYFFYNLKHWNTFNYYMPVFHKPKLQKKYELMWSILFQNLALIHLALIHLALMWFDL